MARKMWVQLRKQENQLGLKDEPPTLLEKKYDSMLSDNLILLSDTAPDPKPWLISKYFVAIKVFVNFFNFQESSTF
jgi:hypothetical protein